MVVVSLAEIVEALDLQSNEMRSSLDPETGEIITFSEEMAHIAEGGNWERAPEWMQAMLPKIKRALEDNRMLELPDRVHIDEWRMMQDFASEDAQCHCRAELSSAATGEGAFARFRDAVRGLGLEQDWYTYRETAYEKVARRWLEKNKIPYR
jgi:hypothetical protein